MFPRTHGMIAVMASLKWMFLVFSAAQAQKGFTYPDTQLVFVVGDLVNITWDVPSARFSLYEICATAILLESNSTNNYSYIWNATRDHYQESGCVFELEPLYADGTWRPPNFTSPYFGVDMRYHDDPTPTDWNFGGSGATTTVTSTTETTSTAMITATSTATPTTTTSSIASASTTTTSAITSSPSSTDSGLSSGQKAGIGVGVSLGVLLLCSLGFLFVWYRRRRYTQFPQADTSTGSGAMAQQRGTAEMREDTKPTVPGNNRYLSGTETVVSELSSQNYDENESSYRDSTVRRPISELMGTPRAEME